MAHMAHFRTCYADNDTGTGYYKVTYRVNATKKVLTRSFDSLYFARKFVNKLKYSKRCTLISYPLFD